MNFTHRFATLIASAALLAPWWSATAATVRVTDVAGKPLATVMVSRQPVNRAPVDTSDNGYAASGTPRGLAALPPR